MPANRPPLDAIGDKVCCRCRRELPRSRFVADRRHVDGLAGHCRECHAARSRAWRRRHPEHNERRRLRRAAERRAA